MRFFAILERFWSDFGRFSGTKMEVKIDFWQVFQKTSIFWKSLFFLRKLLFFRLRAHKFNENSTQNRIRKYICFKRWLFSVFWRFLVDFGTILDGSKSLKIQNAAPGALQKLTKKHSRWPKSRFWGVSRTHLFSKVGLGRVLEGFWKDFWWIFWGCRPLVDSYFAAVGGFGRIFGGFLGLQTTCWLLFCLSGTCSD